MPLRLPFTIDVHFRVPQLEAIMSAATEKLAELATVVAGLKSSADAAFARITADFDELKRKAAEGAVSPDDLASLGSSIDALGAVKSALDTVDPDPDFPAAIP